MSLELERSLAEIPIFDVHTHLVGGRLAAARAARLAALSYGRQRSLCGGLPERSAADAVSRLAFARRGDHADRGGFALFAPHPEHILVLGLADHSSPSLRMAGADRQVELETPRRDDSRTVERPKLAARGAQPGRHRTHRHRARPARKWIGRRSPAVLPRMGLLHEVPVGRIRYGPL